MKPIIVIPMGDPAGIGPEIVAKALSNEEIFQCARCVVTGDKKVMEQAVKLVKLPMDIQVIKEPEEGRFEKNVINLIDLDNVDMAQFKLGEISAMCGQAAYEYIAESIFLANSGKADAVSTTPINKESLRAAGVPFIGHTEIFGALTNTPDPLTMFEVRNMRVFFLTRHVSLKQACDMITKERVVDYVKRCTRALCQLGAEAGTMAIAGLNPHSGEHGLFGNEELDAIYPAVKELQDKGYKVVGPVGADSVFHLALRGKFNSVLSLYHDQGHIATKTLDFERTIAVTAGMPILRTSVDHGTAMDIAGTGLASDVSMVEAIRLAARYSPSFVKK